jgi:predicted amidohydrolase
VARGTGEREVREPLTVAAAQPAGTPYDVAANARAHAAAVRAARARVVVFPELSLTGYHFDAPAVPTDDPALAPLVEACAETGTLALAGAPVGPDSADTDADSADTGADSAATDVFIGLLAVDGRGATVAYRKIWLGDEEAQHFRAGPDPAVVEVDGWRLGLAVCKDTGVAAHAVATAALGIDAYVSSVVKRAEDAHVMAERAHRIATAHGVWVAAAVSAGPTGEGYDRTAGGSGIWRPDGSAVARAGAEPGEIARAVLC